MFPEAVPLSSIQRSRNVPRYEVVSERQQDLSGFSVDFPGWKKITAAEMYRLMQLELSRLFSNDIIVKEHNPAGLKCQEGKPILLNRSGSANLLLD